MSKKKILCVEDDLDQLLGLTGILRLGGYDVYSATEGVAAIAQAKKHQPDVILLDIGLPAGDGFWFLDTLRSSTGPETDIPVIVLTARADPETRERAYEAGASGFGQKPIDPDDLLGSIESLLSA